MGNDKENSGKGPENKGGRSSEVKAEKLLKYQLAPKANGKIPFGIELQGFLDGSVVITDEILQGKHGEKIIRAIQNWENETGKKVIGEQIILK